MPIKRLKQAWPAPAAWYSVLPVSIPQMTVPTGTASQNSTAPLLPWRFDAVPWAMRSVPHQIYVGHELRSPPLGCVPAACGSPGIHLHEASQRTRPEILPRVLLFGLLGTHTER